MRERSKGGYKKKYKESVTGVREMRRRKRERKDRMERERNEEEGGSIFPCVRGLNALVGLKWSGALTDRPPGTKTQPIYQIPRDPLLHAGKKVNCFPWLVVKSTQLAWSWV